MSQSIYPSMRLLRWFGDKPITEGSWQHGIVRDRPRHTIPAAAVYDATDFLFDQPGMAYKRGGTAFQSSAFSGQALVIAVAAPEFPSDSRVIAITTDGAATRTLYDATSGTHGSGIGVHGAQPTENPPVYIDKMILTDGIGNGSGTFYQPQKVYLSAGNVAVADLGGSPPNARCSCVHLERLLLANTTANPNNVYFSPVTGVENTWDTTNATFAVGEPIVGMASVQGVLLIWSRGFMWRVLGSLPPGSVDSNGNPNDDMELQPVGPVGCMDARSIVQMNGVVFWAHESGIYYSNGGAPVSITSLSDGLGIGNLWASAVQGWSPELASVVCAGVWLNKWLFVTVRHAATDAQSGARYQFLWYEPTGAWTRLADGCTADMYATRFAPSQEIYAACGDTGDSVRLLKLSGLVSPSSSNESDANGDAILPTLTMRPLGMELGVGMKHFTTGHVTYRLGESATLTVQQGTGLEEDAAFRTITSLVNTVSGGSPAITRKRILSSLFSMALTLKFTQVGVSDKTELHLVQMDARPLDPSEGQ